KRGCRERWCGSRQQVCGERKTGSIHQSGGKPRRRFGLQHGEEVPGNRRHQPAGRGALRERIHRRGEQWHEQGLLPAGKRSGIQRLCGENHGRFGCVPGNRAGPAGQDVYAGSREEDYGSGGVGLEARARQEFEGMRSWQRCSRKYVPGNTWRRKGLAWGDREMRKQLLGFLVPLMAFVLIAAAADTTGKGVAAGARLQTLGIADSQDGLRVEFKAQGTLTPKVSTLENPARIVIDLPNTVMATAQSHISVGRNGVKDVRVGMDGQVPPNTRVVVDLSNLDLAASRQHELVTGRDGNFVLEIHDAVMAHRQPAAPTAKAVAATEAPKPAVAASAVTSAPAISTNVTKAAPTPAVAENTEKPADLTLVEPKFSVKPGKANDATKPVAKAEEAASRFADKTAAELVAITSNAAMGQAGGTVPVQPAVNLAAEQKTQMEQPKPASNGSK